MRLSRHLVLSAVWFGTVACGGEPSDPQGADAEPEPLVCVDTQSDCGVCTNLDVDTANCGRCELPCGSLEVCIAGVCEDPSGDCAAGHTTCGGDCADLRNDPDNCGGCGTACSSDLVCQRGGCVESCDSGLVDCDGGCIDPATHPAFCGASGACSGAGAGEACSAPAGATATCVDATCSFECPGGTVRCGAECADICRSVIDTPGESVFEVTPGCRRVRITTWGAGGGAGNGNNNQGAGGAATVEVASQPGDLWTVVVGAPGQPGVGQSGGAGGAPGGGAGSNGSSSQGGGGGGGFSAVFRPTIAVENALAIAGGGAGSGGGSGGNTLTGAGGGVDGQDGRNSAGGTQTSGFAQLMGGPGAQNNDGGGGGGSGWFGGTGGGGANADASGGGGGSGFAVADALAATLEAGDRATAGTAAHPDRGTAGNPSSPGKVIVDCIPD